MSTTQIVLIDLSSIAYPIFHQSGSEPNPSWTHDRIVEKVRALASGQPYVAVCCDGKNSRATRLAIDPTYKAQREAAPAALHHQIDLAIGTLKGDGFPVWSMEGHEADDVIASAAWTLISQTVEGAPVDRSVLIVSADKDLLQLVGPHVKQKNPISGTVLDEAAVLEKFGVKPSQMLDYLTLVGDSSDNVKGADGIGPKKAAMLLSQFGSLDKLMMPESQEGLTPGMKTSLLNFCSRCDDVKRILTLVTSLVIPVQHVFLGRVPADTPIRDEAGIAEDIAETMVSAPIPSPMPPTTAPVPFVATPAAASLQGAMPTDSDGLHPSVPNGGKSGHLNIPRPVVSREVTRAIESAALVPQVLPPASFEMQLEPKNLAEAKQLAADIFASRLFSAYGNPPAVLSIIMAGRELGLQTMAALRAFHVVEGKPTLSAGIIQALVMRSPFCEYFRCLERTDDHATFETKRRDNPPLKLTYSMAEAQAAGLVKPNSGWTKHRADMCAKTAATKLARLVYPDVVFNLYAPEEF